MEWESIEKVNRWWLTNEIITWWKIDKTDRSCSSLKLILVLSISKYRSKTSYNDEWLDQDKRRFTLTGSSKISGRRKFINDHISLMLFCTGVPVNKNRLPVWIRRNIAINWHLGFFNRWPSSMTNNGQWCRLKKALKISVKFLRSICVFLTSRWQWRDMQ